MRLTLKKPILNRVNNINVHIIFLYQPLSDLLTKNILINKKHLEGTLRFVYYFVFISYVRVIKTKKKKKKKILRRDILPELYVLVILK